jgi:hypothetical protein
MKHVSRLWLAGAILCPLLFTLAGAQNDPLAEYARHAKKEKEGQPAPKKVYDNDNLPRTEHLSIVGPQAPEVPESIAEGTTESDKSATPAAQPNAPADSEPKADEQAGKLPSVTPGEDSEDRQKVYAEWQKKIADQKQAVDLAERELDVVQREYKLRAAAVYADAGYRLRNSTQWDKEDRQYHEQIEVKQKALEAARQKLTDLQGQARKAGLPPKIRQ